MAEARRKTTLSERKKYQRSTPETTAENLLTRDFYAEAPNLKWATDVTEFKWYQGDKVQKLYLSTILDLYDRSVVSWVVSARNDNKLVLDTFQKAIRANPEAKPLFHSDWGFQYTSKAFQMKLKQQGMEQSMSRVGHCIDNSPTEGFWGIVKSEMYYTRKFTDAASLKKAISDYIDFYNVLFISVVYLTGTCSFQMLTATPFLVSMRMSSSGMSLRSGTTKGPMQL